MSKTEILSKTYEKLNPENQSYALGILQTLKYMQDIISQKIPTDKAGKQKNWKEAANQTGYTLTKFPPT